MPPSSELPVIGVAVFAFRGSWGDDAEVLLLRRAFGDFEGQWCPVAGTVEAGELPLSAALRELTEETGIDIELIEASRLEEIEFKVEFDAANANPTQGPVGAIRIFAAWLPRGDGSAAQPGEDVRLDREHSEFRWVGLDEAERMLPLVEQRRALQRIRGAFLAAATAR